MQLIFDAIIQEVTLSEGEEEKDNVRYVEDGKNVP